MTGDWREPIATRSPLELLRVAADEVGDRPYLDFGGEVLTYRELWDAAATLAGGLRAAGVGRGDTVAAMLDNNADAAASWFAANLLGAAWVGVNTALRGPFLGHVIADAGSPVVLCEADLLDRFEPLGAALVGVRVIAVRGGDATASTIGDAAVLPLDSLRQAAPVPDIVSPAPGDVSLLAYTGGTTGPSKGCIVSHGYVLNLARSFLRQTGRTSDELNWSPLPIYHFNLIGNTITGTLLVRGTAAIAPRFSVSRFWPEVERTGARVVNLLGSMGALLASAPDTPSMQRCHRQIRVVHGAPFDAALQRRWCERFGVELVGGGTYGLTEAVPLTTLPFGTPEPPGASGLRNDDDFDVRIFDDDEGELEPNQIGEVVARPRRPHVMFGGYWRRPEATVAATTNLWFHTGDLGSFDEDGFFHFVDRKQDYLRRRGENISSQELEAVYLTHPDIAQVAVHAVPSELSEDDVKVTGVLVDGSALSAGDLFDWSKDLVPYFALPRYIEFRDALPVSAVGRVHKHQLREEGRTDGTWDREEADVTWDRR